MMLNGTAAKCIQYPSPLSGLWGDLAESIIIRPTPALKSEPMKQPSAPAPRRWIRVTVEKDSISSLGAFLWKCNSLILINGERDEASNGKQLRRMTGERSQQNRTKRRERTTVEREKIRKRAIRKRYVPQLFKTSGMLGSGNPDDIFPQRNLIAENIPIMWTVNHSAGEERLRENSGYEVVRAYCDMHPRSNW